MNELEHKRKIANENYHRNKEYYSKIRKIKYLEKKGVIVKVKEIKFNLI